MEFEREASTSFLVILFRHWCTRQLTFVSYGITDLVIFIMVLFVDCRALLQVCLIFIMSMMVFVEVEFLGKMSKVPFLAVAEDARGS